jgi:thiol:disulfide interchange protein DsbD
MLSIALAGVMPHAVHAQAGPAQAGLAQAGSARTSVVPAQGQAVTGAAARHGPQRVDAVVAELVADVSRAAPGEAFRIGLRLAHDPHWHTYWRNPGDSGLPTRFEPSGPAGSTYGDIVWPVPRRLAIGDLANYGYEGEVVLAREVKLPPGTGSSSARFEVQAQWLVCKDVCIPGEALLALELPVGPAALAAAPATLKLFEASAGNAPRPGAGIEAGWHQRDRTAMLLLPEGAAAKRAEFFPYFEGVVRPAAPQSLMSAAGSDATAGARLALRLEVVGGGGESGLPKPAGGVLLLDGKPVEVGLQPLAAQPAAGRVLSVAEVAPSAPAPVRGLLERLVGGAGSTMAGRMADPAAGLAAGATTGAATGNGDAAAAARPFPSPAIGAPSSTLPIALAGALLGGLILNLMPCVFPVIGLKVLSFSQAAAGSPGLARRHALAFGAGVVLAFLALGLVMLALRHAGEAAGWGFQMQSPVFVGAMALLFVLIGLNLFGVFETGILLTRLAPVPPGASIPGAIGDGGVAGEGKLRGAGRGTRRGKGFGNSFGTGVIAVLVATPCTAPFMGSAVGYTLGSPPLQTLLIFAALGLGMALPYLVLGWAPWLLRWLPRPGPWLLAFKQLLAFPMLATAAWLAWVLTLQAGADGLLRLLMSAILLGFAAWIYGRAQQAAFGGRARPGAVGFAAAAVAGALTVWQLVQIGLTASSGNGAATAAVQTTQPGPGLGPLGASSGVSTSSGPVVETVAGPADAGIAQWQPWSSQKVAQSLAQGNPVLVDFTAAWCISCQANKKLVLERDVVRRSFASQGVTLLRADWTRRDPAITAELARFGRNGVPLYLVYHSLEQPPLMLPELLTVDVVLAAIANGR